ncbi:hypothetical protein LCGC14_2043700 [marine sediment metagenome]|uniref:Uncharacterized protein n=1 Tax=marine sediment metagenome TaxID=412755 RepID=A0A0F9ER80_9ZZZZ
MKEFLKGFLAAALLVLISFLIVPWIGGFVAFMIGKNLDWIADSYFGDYWPWVLSFF